jgi:hypothetical protein
MSDALKEFDMALDHMKKTSRDLWDYAHEKREDVISAQVQTDVALGILAEAYDMREDLVRKFIIDEVANMPDRERKVFGKLLASAPREG